MIYLDNAATTIPSKTALESARKFNEESFFNPSALYHGGINNHNEIKEAKDFILRSISANSHEVIFTSCGSESDNQAVFCNSCRGAFLTDLGEHAAIYKSFTELEKRGKKVYYAPLNADGSVNTEELYKIISQDKTIDFVSIVHVNNETGAINDINAISKKIKTINNKIIFHSDGVQAFGKIPYKIGEFVDLYSVSAHKLNALKGTGALIKKKNVNIKPLIFGGGQEDGLRSGTENIFGIKVFHYAMAEHFSTIKEDFSYVSGLKETFASQLNSDIFKVISGNDSSPYILSVSAVGLRGEVIMHALEEKEIIVGNGSACSSKNRFSRVLGACGYNNEVLDGVIRISFSNKTSEDDVRYSVKVLNEICVNLKGIM